MDISISEQNQERIKRKLADGKYFSPDDVIAKALELLDEQEEELEWELADMRAKVQRGTEEADANEVIPASDVFEELRRRNTDLDKRRQ